jgi:hypothetical protein
MDDLDTVALLLAEAEPSAETVARSRGRLDARIGDDRRPSPRPRRRTSGRPQPGRRLLAGAVAAAAAIAVLAVVLTSGGSPADTPQRLPAVPAPPPAHHLLLTVADTAAAMPAGAGAYWHVTTRVGGAAHGPARRTDSWTARDGRRWLRGGKTGGDVVELTRPAPFRLAGAGLSIAQLQRLPTDPAALKAWLADQVRHGAGTTSAGRPDAATRRRAVLASLTALVSQLPAPPAVRGAAFRAIATLPHVEDLGSVAGGHGVLISAGGRDARLVVDPHTSRVRRTSFYVTADGAEVWLAGGRAATIRSGWTGALPGDRGARAPRGLSRRA